ncbi:hypothetical protein SAY87_020371 [Trapa incisa]|uniref:Uncharacterized protein n=1 Tax=Trapa incisa TaxID=236973 RepID=A0AAN7K9W1_9MYRT|nr:hypothetical protein SAY87_020371 [Trapa incisa]
MTEKWKKDEIGLELLLRQTAGLKCSSIYCLRLWINEKWGAFFQVKGFGKIQRCVFFVYRLLSSSCNCASQYEIKDEIKGLFSLELIESCLCIFSQLCSESFVDFVLHHS